MNHENIPISSVDRERKYFDSAASSLTTKQLVMTDDNIDRYRHPKGGATATPHEFVYHLLMPLAGKRVLDFACGDGEHSCLLAACGAHVTAFDLSPVAVEKARSRIALNKFEGCIDVDVREAGKTGYSSGAFDLVVGIAVLHHLTMCLPDVLEEIGRVLAPGGVAIFLEPVACSPLLRRVRKLVPVKTCATEDERQLNSGDLALLRQYFGAVECWHYRCLVRLGRILGPWVGSLLRPLDYYAVRLFPGLSRFYGTVVIRLSCPIKNAKHSSQPRTKQD